MKVRAKDVINLPIYTIKDGRRLDKPVKDVVYDPQSNRVEAIVLDEGGWFADAKIVLLHDIHSIGEDVVLIDDMTQIRQAKEVKEEVASIAKGENYLTTDKIITEDGMEIGTISDIIFDTATGYVEEFEVSQDPLKDATTGKKKFKTTDIITVGKDAIIVSAYTKQSFDQQAKERGIMGRVNQAKEQTPSVIDTVKQKAQELAEKTQEKVEDITTHEKTQDIKEQTQEKVLQAKESSKQKIHEALRIVDEKRKERSLGRYLTKNIVLANDHVLANRGDLVTHQLLAQAEKHNQLENILQHTSDSRPLDDESSVSTTSPSSSSLNLTQPKTSEGEESDVTTKTSRETVTASHQPSYSLYGTLGGKSEQSKEHSEETQKREEVKINAENDTGDIQRSE